MDALVLALIGLLFLFTALRFERITQRVDLLGGACRGSHSRIDRRLDALDERARFCSCRLERQATYSRPEDN